MIDRRETRGVIIFRAGWRAAFTCDGVIEIAEAPAPPSYRVAFPVAPERDRDRDPHTGAPTGWRSAD